MQGLNNAIVLKHITSNLCVRM